MVFLFYFLCLESQQSNLQINQHFKLSLPHLLDSSCLMETSRLTKTVNLQCTETVRYMPSLPRKRSVRFSDRLKKVLGCMGGFLRCCFKIRTLIAIMNNLFPNMPKTARKKQSHCERHDFSLKPRSQYTYQPQYFQVSFCAKLQGHSSKKDAVETAECLNCPTFNKDANFATPTFILASEQGLDEVQGERMREDHVRRMVNYTDEKSQLNVPKPRSKNNYCSVCRNTYSDYLQHIESPLHKKKIKGCEFNKHILELTQQFQQTQPARNTHPLKSDDSVEIISNPNKKIKPNETLTIPNTQTQRSGEWQNHMGFPNVCMEVPPFMNGHRTIPTFHETLNNYNFNINMNLYLRPSMPGMNFMAPYNPYLNFNYQSMLLSQLNQLPQSFNGGLYGVNPACLPNGPKASRRVDYIIIDDE